VSIVKVAEASLPTRFGAFTIHAFRDETDIEHVALAAGTPRNGCAVRVHSECATGDILGSLRCDCGEQLAAALTSIAAVGEGLLIYLRGHEGRGIGLGNKIKAYALQDRGADTVEANHQLGFPADQRDYRAAIAILESFGLTEIRLLTNNPDKIAALEEGGIRIAERLPLWTPDNPHSHRYLETKRLLMGHIAPA
jgi:GTP cyclohydrolase II